MNVYREYNILTLTTVSTLHLLLLVVVEVLELVEVFLGHAAGTRNKIKTKKLIESNTPPPKTNS